MNIAIIAPSPVPYAVGGAENLWWGLLNALNQYTAHQVELIKLPTPEQNFWDLVSSYKKFSELDLSYFDMVISTKYPAWMVNHKNHVCYMQHRLRGLYDAYPFCVKVADSEKHLSLNSQRLSQILCNSRPSRDVLPDLWGELERLRQIAEETSPVAKAFKFPGPLTRRIIHFLDKIALNNCSIQRFFAISENVKKRQDYFPGEAKIEVIHHPSNLKYFSNSNYRNIFTISRLDNPKRIDLLIEAFIATNINTEFRIAGTGPEQDKLKNLAQKDTRIKLLGRITDEEVIGEYGEALFVPYIPFDEDYGLITIEAMSSAKAVLTTKDSGGVNEFVESGINGLTVEPSVEAISRAMDELFSNPQKTISMGNNALQSVAHISWQNTISGLLSLKDSLNPASTSKPPFHGPVTKKFDTGVPKKRIVLVVSFPVCPPFGGGQTRIYELCKELSRFVDVTIVSLSGRDHRILTKSINARFKEIQVPKSQKHLEHENLLSDQLNASVEDLAAIFGYRYSPDFIEILTQEVKNADLVFASHPYLFYAIRDVYKGEIWYDALNVEFDMKCSVLEQALKDRQIQGDLDSPHTYEETRGFVDTYLKHTRKVEHDCLKASSAVTMCSNDDRLRLLELYEVGERPVWVVPNGVALESSHYLARHAKNDLANKLGLNGQLSILFIGSYHGPNIEALEEIITIAKACIRTCFLIVGTVCDHPLSHKLPCNVTALGRISDSEKSVLLNAVDLTINPILSGSGTNLKMLDYAASGTPILTTPFGNRGLGFVHNKEVLIYELDRFPEVINRISQNLFGSDRKAVITQQILLDGLSINAYKKVKRYYSWKSIVSHLVPKLGLTFSSDE